MNVVFTPALGQTVNVPIPDNDIDQDAVVFRFTADVGEAEYQRVHGNGGQFQVWSDIPLAGQGVGGWKEVNFETEGDDTQPAESGTGAALQLSLTNASDQGRPTSERRRLVAQIPLTLSAFQIQDGIHFSFTYRIVYPSGEIVWLGQFDYNGTVALSRDQPSELALNEQGRIGLSDHWRIFEVDNELSSPLNVGKLANTLDYQVWAFGRNGYPSSSYIAPEANLLILLPRTFGFYSFKPAYILSASAGVGISISDDGCTTAVGSGTVLIQTCRSPSQLETLIQSALTRNGRAESARVIIGKDPQYMLLLSSKGKVPVKAVLVPLGVSSRCTTTINVGIDSLTEAFEDDTAPAQFSIFSPLTYDLRFFETAATTIAGNTIPFVVDSCGGEFILGPVHDLGGSPQRRVKISFLCPYIPLPPPTEEWVVLPTPPPSPPPQNGRSQVTFAPMDTLIPAPKYIEPEPSPSFRRRTTASRPFSPSQTTREEGAADATSGERERRRFRLLHLIYSCYSALAFYVRMFFCYFFIWGKPRDIAEREPTRTNSEDESSATASDAHEPESRTPAHHPQSAISIAQDAVAHLRTNGDNQVQVQVPRSSEGEEGSDVTASSQGGGGGVFDREIGKSEQSPVIGLSTGVDMPTRVLPLPAASTDGLAPTSTSTTTTITTATASAPPSATVFYAELPLSQEKPPASVGFVLCVGSGSITEESAEPPTISSLSQAIKVNGDVPDGLGVRKLKEVLGEGDAAWSYYLVEFAVVPSQGKIQRTVVKISSTM